MKTEELRLKLIKKIITTVTRKGLNSDEEEADILLSNIIECLYKTDDELLQSNILKID